jgi:hypothetical protein
MANELDLKTLLEHNFKMILNTLETTRKLVLDVQASHYWTRHALDVFTQLKNIGNNIDKMLLTCTEKLARGNQAFRDPEVMKLWKTVVGLYRAMPPVQKKFTDQLARRRRERIMGEEIIQPEDIAPETLAADQLQFTTISEELVVEYTNRLALVADLGDGLIPDQAAVEEDIKREKRREQAAATASDEPPA